MFTKTFVILSILGLFLFIACGDSKKDEQPKDIHEQHEMHDHDGHQHDDTIDSEQPEEISSANDTIALKTEETPVLQGTKNKPIKATIVNLQDIIIGGTGNLTPDRAERLIAQGQLIGVKINNDIYIIFDAGGTVPVQLLKKYAGKNVGLIGKSSILGDLKIFIADDIIPM